MEDEKALRRFRSTKGKLQQIGGIDWGWSTNKIDNTLYGYKDEQSSDPRPKLQNM
jgi:hypothetical protein